MVLICNGGFIPCLARERGFFFWCPQWRLLLPSLYHLLSFLISLERLCVKVEFVPTRYSAVKNNFGGCPGFLLFAGGTEGFLSEDWLIGTLSKGISLFQDLNWVLWRTRQGRRGNRIKSNPKFWNCARFLNQILPELAKVDNLPLRNAFSFVIWRIVSKTPPIWIFTFVRICGPGFLWSIMPKSYAGESTGGHRTRLEGQVEGKPPNLQRLRCNF